MERVYRVAASAALLEGPVVRPDGSVIVSDIVGDRLLRIDAAGVDGVATTLRFPSRRANGNAIDGTGRLITCEGAEHGPGGGRRVVREESGTDGLTVLADRFGDGRLNSPNDVTTDAAGNIYFTDPRYGDRSDLELDHEGVYRIGTGGDLRLLVAQPDIGRPNGLAVSPDGATLYVVDSDYDRLDANRCIWAFDLGADGTLGRQRRIVDFGRGRGADGMEVDRDGTLHVCAGIARPRGPNETAEVAPGVYRFRPDGSPIDRLPVPVDLITNCAFGGLDGRTLFVTAGNDLYRTTVDGPDWRPIRSGDRGPSTAQA